MVIVRFLVVKHKSTLHQCVCCKLDYFSPYDDFLPWQPTGIHGFMETLKGKKISIVCGISTETRVFQRSAFKPSFIWAVAEKTVVAASWHWSWHVQSFTLRLAGICAPVIRPKHSNRPEVGWRAGHGVLTVSYLWRGHSNRQTNDRYYTCNCSNHQPPQVIYLMHFQSPLWLWWHFSLEVVCFYQWLESQKKMNIISYIFLNQEKKLC